MFTCPVFTAQYRVFEVITLVWANQPNCFENTLHCIKITPHMATQLWLTVHFIEHCFLFSVSEKGNKSIEEALFVKNGGGFFADLWSWQSRLFSPPTFASNKFVPYTFFPRQFRRQGPRKRLRETKKARMRTDGREEKKGGRERERMILR